MQEDTEIVYRGYRIYLNKWGEHCVLKKGAEGMVSYKAGFKYLKTAKAFVLELGGRGILFPYEIDKLAKKFREAELLKK